MYTIYTSCPPAALTSRRQALPTATKLNFRNILGRRAAPHIGLPISSRALSLPTSGCVTISWNEALDAGGARHLSLLWQESGGPEVKAPRRSGFGSKLIKQAAGGAKGSVDLRFPPDGVICVLTLALIDEGAHLLLGPGGGLESNSE